MLFHWNIREHVAQFAFVLRWLAIGIPVGVVTGLAVAFFLAALDTVTRWHWEYPWLLYLLPLAGLITGLVYNRWGQCSEAGNNLVIEQIHEPGGGVPARMAPLVLFGTLLTHLFGGSAGREGTAVQMGGSLANTLGRILQLSTDDTRIVLMSGVAAGFGAVFGTPLTGAIFALEVLAIGTLNYRAVVPCLIASIVGDQITTACGIGHTQYHIESIVVSPHSAHAITLDWSIAGKVALSAIAFGLVSVVFARLTHAVSAAGRRYIHRPWLRPAVGGCLVVVLVWMLDCRDYLGLGVSTNPHDPLAVTIQTCFQPGGVQWFSWWWKLLFTAITVGSGFKGGEVTPLFFIGAALGHVLGILLGVPVDLMAGLGFVAVFAGATNTPLACTIMAVELFAPANGELLSSGFVVYSAIACFLAFYLSGRTSIYAAQRPGISDATTPNPAA